MSYNILGINPGHNGSVALLVDGELVYYIEEERLTRRKYDGNPFKSILEVVSRWHIDEIVVAGTSTDLPRMPWTTEDAYHSLIRKYFNKEVKVEYAGSEHHLSHAATAFYNSGFDEAVAIVADGAGSLKEEFDENKNLLFRGYEVESAWKCDYDGPIRLIYKGHGGNIGNRIFCANGMIEYDSAVGITKAYEAVSDYLGFGYIEAGKTMGLSSYGKQDPSIPPLFVGNRGSKDVFIPEYPSGARIDQLRWPQFRQQRSPKEWHNDPSKLSDIEKNLAWRVQNDTQEIISSLIEYASSKAQCKNIVISGGYGLNCVSNYYFKKKFPEFNIYCEPISHDGGSAIGAAKMKWYSTKRAAELNATATKHIQTSIYYGPEYKLDTIKAKVEAVSDTFTTQSVSYSDVAKLISDKNIVAMYQGRSEAGPRALGNRSILYDPRDPDGKDFVNTVKGREWFRPFAGTVLAEDANEWFDMAGMDESPFMMYAVNVVADKVNQIAAITHVDDTCRVQTVTETQNKHYYNLIKEFNKITNVPILFNTSFNLAGDPLVETIEDAFDALVRSKMKYLYLPELNLLLTKTIPDPIDKPEKETLEVADEVADKVTDDVTDAKVVEFE